VHNAEQQEVQLKSQAFTLHLILGSSGGGHHLPLVALAGSGILDFYCVDYPFILAINTPLAIGARRF
jgi:hypothetical protein